MSRICFKNKYHLFYAVFSRFWLIPIPNLPKFDTRWRSYGIFKLTVCHLGTWHVAKTAKSIIVKFQWPFARTLHHGEVHFPNCLIPMRLYDAGASGLGPNWQSKGHQNCGMSWWAPSSHSSFFQWATAIVARRGGPVNWDFWLFFSLV